MMTNSALAPATLADELCRHINCRNIGAWLHDLAATFDLPPKALMPEPPISRHEIVVPHRGLALVLSHPHAGHVDVGDPDRWIMTDARFDLAGQFDAHWRDALPFGLDAASETMESIAMKLGDDSTILSSRDLATGNRRQSYFMDDALVVEVVWTPDLKGLERVSAARLGGELLEPPGADSHTS